MHQVQLLQPILQYQIIQEQHLQFHQSDSAAVSVTGGVSANSLALTTALPVTSGGTGFGSVATGDLIYGSGTNILGKISKGTDGQILSLAKWRAFMDKCTRVLLLLQA